MKLKSENGKVVFQMRVGEDFVQNTMSEESAKEMIANGIVTQSERDGFPICVNDDWFFPAVQEEPTDKSRRAKR